MLENDISNLKEAFRLYIIIKLKHEVDDYMTFYPEMNRYSVEKQFEEEYKRIFDLLS
jgi:hypothetical protein